MSQAFLAGLANDVAEIDGDVANFAVWSGFEARWVWGGDGNSAGPEGFPFDAFILRTLGTEALLSGANPADLAAEVASILQDQVIDRLGRGWPELSENGLFSELLQPDLVEGRPVWAGVRHSCDFGDLYAKYATLLDPSPS